MKTFRFLLVALLLLGFAYSAEAITGDIAQYPDLPNPVIYGGSGGATGVSPATTIVRVRYGLCNNANVSNGTEAIASGDVLSWDINSADGVTVTKCIVNSNVGYAGVAVTDIATADSTKKQGNERNWGWMAIHGPVLAKCDASQTAKGGALMCAGGDLPGAFGTAGSVIMTSINTTTSAMSTDIGIALETPATDTLSRVWLRGR